MKNKLVAGDTAPNFTAKDQHGNTVSLMDFSNQKVVLAFYVHNDKKGVNQELTKIQNDLNKIEKEGFAVVAISPDSVESNQKYAKELDVTFPILSDMDHNIGRSYDAFGSKKVNGQEQEGPIRITYLIGTRGTIEAVINPVDDSHAGAQILDVYRKLQEGEHV